MVRLVTTNTSSRHWTGDRKYLVSPQTNCLIRSEPRRPIGLPVRLPAGQRLQGPGSKHGTTWWCRATWLPYQDDMPAGLGIIESTPIEADDPAFATVAGWFRLRPAANR
jgi:hypothetical protein